MSALIVPLMIVLISSSFKIYYWRYPLLLHRILVYGSLFIELIIIYSYAFSNFGFNYTDTDSARYLLSSLIQSEAAVLAIVVALSLVAVQQSVLYSPKTVGLFKSIYTNPDFYILVGIYLTSILYGAWLLKQIITPDIDPFPLAEINKEVYYLALENQIQFKYFLSAFAFISLVPYIRNTLDLINPKNIMDILAHKVTTKSLSSMKVDEYNVKDSCIVVDSIKENLYYYTNIKHTVTLKNYINDKELESFTEKCLCGFIIEDKNPYQPIIDIVNESLIKSDFETARYGLKAIKKSTFEAHKNDFDDDTFVLRYLNYKLVNIGKLAIKKNDEISIDKTLMNLSHNGFLLIKKNIKLFNVNEIIEELAKLSTEMNYVFVIERAQMILLGFTLELIEKNHKELVLDTVKSMKNIRDIAISKNINKVVDEWDCYSKDLLKFGTEKNIEYLQELTKILSDEDLVSLY